MRAENRIHEVPLQKISPPAANVQPSLQADAPEDELDLAALVGTLYEGRWIIAALAVLALMIGGLRAFTVTPVFKADALVQVEESGGSDPLQDLSAMFSGETPAEAEIEILRSRSVVSDAVKALRLDIHAQPMHAPVVGGFFARRHSDEAPASPLLGMSSFAWGGEQIQVQSLEVSRGLEGEDLVLVAEADDGFRVLSSEGDALVRGRVGEVASGNGVELLVSELIARPGTRFELKKLPLLDAVSQLQEGLRVREKGKQTGVIQLELEGPDRARISQSLDALMAAYLRRNVEHKAEEAQKTLDFVRGQLPLLKANLEAAEQKLKEYRAKSGRLDLTIEAQAMVDRAADVEKAISELELQRAELRQRYTDKHPSVTALRNKLRRLHDEKKVLDTQARTLPENELESVRLVRDVTVANELYVLLLTKAQEIDVLKSGTIGNVRVIDSAVTHPKPVSPKKGMTLALSLMLGLFAGVGLVFLRKALNRGVQDPDLLEQQLGLPVFANIPFSSKQTEIARVLERKKGSMKPLAITDPADLAIESLRSLRTSLQFSLAASKNNVVMVGGSRPGIGKSFVSVNLAHVLADTGRRVLLVDGDLRKGHLHRYFGQAREGGLSEAISGAELGTLVHKTAAANLDFLSSGTLPPNPSELLGSERFDEVMAKASEDYDLVVIDAPPVLAVTDAALIARTAGVNLMVAKCGLHPLRELALAVTRMEQNGTRPSGFVFNAVPLRDRVNGYHYQYDYR